MFAALMEDRPGCGTEEGGGETAEFRDRRQRTRRDHIDRGKSGRIDLLSPARLDAQVQAKATADLPEEAGLLSRRLDEDEVPLGQGRDGEGDGGKAAAAS